MTSGSLPARTDPMIAVGATIRSCSTYRGPMDIVSYTAIRNNLAKALDQVNDDCVPIIITRQKGRPAVLMSLEEFRSWEETLYLIRSPKNAARLNRAIADIEAGRVKRHPLLPVKSSGPTKPGRTISGGKKMTGKSSRASTR